MKLKTKKRLSFVALIALAAFIASPGMCATAVDSFLGAERFELTPRLSDRKMFTVEVAMDGTVLAPIGGGNLKISTDGGDSWEVVRAGIGGTPVVNEATGEALFLALPYRSERLLDDPAEGGGYYFTVHRSEDHGRTWERTRAVIHKDVNGWLPSSGGAENGVTLQYGENAGRLLVPSRVFVNYERRGDYHLQHYNTAIYSDDNGATWHTSAPFPERGTGEGTLAELSDGSVYYNSRSHAAEDAKRREAWSHDGGETWENLQISFLPDRSGRRDPSYGCKAGLIRLPLDDEDVLVYSQLDIAPETPYRSHITVWASFDGARTWPVKRLVYPGPGGYSMLAAGRPGTASEGWIYLMFEGYPEEERGERPWREQDQYLARFNLAWILGGELTGNGSIPRRFLDPRE